MVICVVVVPFILLARVKGWGHSITTGNSVGKEGEGETVVQEALGGSAYLAPPLYIDGVGGRMGVGDKGVHDTPHTKKGTSHSSPSFLTTRRFDFTFSRSLLLAPPPATLRTRRASA